MRSGISGTICVGLLQLLVIVSVALIALRSLPLWLLVQLWSPPLGVDSCRLVM